MKYNNSMYTTIPPTITICEDADELFVLNQLDAQQEQIDEHNFEESYDLNNIKTEIKIEENYFKELTKNEPTNKLIH